jgi:hypothetical protein
LIWCRRHGRVRLSYTASEQERIRNGALERRDGAVDGVGGGERPIVVALAIASAAMLEDPAVRRGRR